MIFKFLFPSASHGRVARHTHDAILITTTLFLIASMIVSQTALGASYTWTQSSWVGGADGGTGAVHAANQSNWNKYSSVSQMTVGTNLHLATTTAMTVQTDDTNSATGFNLTGSSFAQTQLVGTGASSSVTLAYGNLTTSSISSGQSHTLAVRADGAVFAWGYNSAGQLGINSTVQQTTPVQVHGVGNVGYLTNVISVVATTLNSYALKSDGTVYGWGINIYGNLGIASTSQKLVPTQVLGVGGVGYLTGIIAIAAGDYSVFALKSDGTVYAWGDNSSGQLGINSTVQQNAPVQMLDANGVDYFTNAVAIGAGGTNSYIVKSDGTLYSLGGSLEGQTGINSFSISLKIPTQVHGVNNVGYLTGVSAVKSAGGRTTLALESDGTLFGFGRNNEGELATNNTNSGAVPIQALGVGGSGYLTGISSIAGGGTHVLAIKTDGTLYAWGYNANGQIGMATTTPMLIKVPTQVLGVGGVGYLTGIISIAGGTNSSFAVKSDNTVYGWGINSNGQLGINSTAQQTAPVQVHGVGNVGYLSLNSTGYVASGVYTSGVVDIGAPVSGWGTLSWVNGTAQSITIKARTSATTDFSGVPWTSCSAITSGGTLYSGGCVSDQHRYIQYQASLSTSDTSVTPSLDSVTFTYNLYTSTGNLVSSVYDTGDATSIIASLSWTEDASLPLETTSTVSLRAASTTDLLASSTWNDFSFSSSGCSKNAGLVMCPTAALPAAMRVSGTNRYMQYKVLLDSSGKYSPTITDVRVVYVQNAPPEFNPGYGTGGVSVSQSSAADATLGKVMISYSVRDPDTDVGSPANQYKITPSFEYNTGSGWTAIPSQYLATGDLDVKTVASSTYLLYNATWDAKSQLSSGYYPSTQVRVTINDGEAASNIGQASVTIPVDTKAPVVGGITASGALKTIGFTITDDSSYQYILTNTNDGTTADGANAISGVWQSSVTSTISISSWIFSNLGDYVNVYGSAKDIYGNTAPISIVFPGIPQNVDLKDISNASIGAYREFVSWKLYTSTPSATFSKYALYRSLDGASYSLLSNVTDINQNYYTDNAVSSSTIYYYKVAVVDTDGDKSDYSATVSDRPDGQGGTDFTPPTITAAATAQVQTTWAKITWTTDEIADSEVDYSTPGKTYGSSQTSTALVTSHSIVLQNLTPNSTYFYRVKSKDPFNNQATDDSAGAGYSFTTPGGPAISVVSIPLVSDKGATITWNTDKASDSYVTYATDISNLQTGVGVTRIGSAATTTAHKVDVVGLQARTKYYFYVESTDAESGYTSVDNNAGLYYFLGTSYDMVPPVISGISTPVTTPSSIVAVWQTDELAAGKINYGTHTGSYNLSTDQESLLSIYHTAVLPSLTASTPYYFQITSMDAAGNTGTSAEQVATTSAAGEVKIEYLNSGGGGSAAANTDTTAPTISDVVVSDIGAFEAKVSFTTNELALGIASVGDTTSYGKTVSDTAYANKHIISLYGLQLGTTYHVQVKATDQSGNIATSPDTTFTTKYIAEVSQNLRTIENAEQFQAQLDNLVSSMLPSLAPPFIGEVSVSDVNDTSATITWPTNSKTFGGVAYSTAHEYDASSTYATEVSESQGKANDHKITLIGLSPSTKYHFQARAFVFPGVVGGSPDKTFATKAAKINPSITNLKNDSATVSWMTQTETSSFVEFKNAKTGKVEQTGTEDKTKSHVVVVQNLAPGTRYSLRAFGYDKNNTLVEGESAVINTKKDVAAPVISAVAVSNAFIPQRTNQLQTILTWKTDEPGTTEVYYEEGLGAGDTLANMVGTKEEHTLQHTVILPGFKTGTVYRLQIVSVDFAGNTGKTPMRTIITPVSNESVLEVIVKNFEDAFGFLNKVNQ